MVADNCTPGKCTLLLTGYLRARSLSVNQLVQFFFLVLPFFLLQVV